MINCSENDGGNAFVNYLFKRRLYEPGGKFFKTRLRFSGYLAGCFTRGAHFMLWDHRKFARATLTHKPISAKHVARVWVEFTKTSQHWRFEKVRRGRSFRWKVSPSNAPAAAQLSGMSDGEIRARLVGYIKGTAAREGAFRTGELFMQHFCKTTGAPRARVEKALRRIDGIEGLKVRPRQVGDRFFLKISLPHFPLSVSSPTGRIKNTETTRERVFAGQSSGSLRSHPRPSGPQETGLRPGQPLRGCGMAFEGRWVSVARLHALACHLATGPLRSEHHDGVLVRWCFPHARNFALAGLVGGHPVEAIKRAYAAGVAESHADARDKNEESPRAPSAAVSYARKFLNDGQTPEARWARFFASDPAQIEVRRLCAVRNFNSMNTNEDTAQNAVVNAAEKSSDAAATELFEKRRAFLCEQVVKEGYTMKQFRLMPQAMKDRFAKAAIEAFPSNYLFRAGSAAAGSEPGPT